MFLLFTGGPRAAMLLCVLLLGASASLTTWAQPADPAPLGDEVIQRLTRERIPPLDPLPELLARRLDEASALLREVQRGGAASVAFGSNDQASAGRSTRFAAQAAELQALRLEARARLAATRARFESLGLADKTREWDALTARIENRFEQVQRAMLSVRNAAGQAGQQAAALALAEISAARSSAEAPDNAAMPATRPNWRSDKPQPKSVLKKSDQLPRYLTNHRSGDTLYAFLGNTLLAAAPPVVDSASQCGTPTELAASLAETEDVRITPEIRNLAESLKYSPPKILQHLNQNIAFEPYYGSLKGSVGTLVAQAGGATDQASLLIALLRASNIPARYVKGQITVSDVTPDPLGGRIGRWLGAKSYAGAGAMLGQGQNPSVSTLSNSSNQTIGVSLAHVWVEACVPYSHYRGVQQDTVGARWIPLDASFKDARYQAGIVTNVSFDYAGFLARRTSVLPDEYFAGQVQQAVRNAAVGPFQSNNTLADVPYRGTVQPLLLDVLPANTPYEVNSFLAWDGTTLPAVAALPDSHRHKLNITAGSATGTQLLASTLSLPQTSLSRVTLSFQGATTADQTALAAWQNDGTLASALPCTVNVVPVIKGLLAGQEGSTLATGPAATPVGLCSSNNRLTMSVTLAELASATLNSVAYNNISAANYHALQAYAFQASDRLLNERSAGLLASVRAVASPNANLEATEGEFLHLVGLKYMRHISDSSKRIGQLDGGSGDVGNHLGLTATQMKVIYLFDVPFAVARTGFLIDVPGGRSRTVDLVTGKLVWKTFLLSGYSMSAFEYYIWQENVRMDAVSTTRGLQFASEASIPLLTTNSANWAAQSATITATPGCSISNTDLNYPQCFLDSIKTNYIDRGFTVTLPRSLILYGNWRGSIFVAALDNTANNSGLESVAAFIINGYSGGYTVQSAAAPQTTYDPAADSGFVTPNPSVAQPTNNAGLNNGFDPKNTVLDGDLNVATGSVFRTERDFSAMGRGGLPIVLERSYNSRNPQPGPFGYGWTHSFNQYLSFKDDNGNGVADAADTNGLTSSVGWTDGTGGEKLFAVAGSGSGVLIGSTFTRLPGTFATMDRQADGSFTVREKDGLTYVFESVAGTINQKARLTAIRDRNNNTLTLSYNASCANNLCSVTDPLGRALTLTYDASARVTRITDWTGRQYGYAYADGNGNLTAYSNPQALAGQQPPVTYQYYGAADGTNLNHLLKAFKLPRGNGLAYEYYATGKLFRRTDALGYTRSYTYNDFRRETTEVNERGATKSYLFDRYGNTTQLIDENGQSHLWGYDTATPANVHNRIRSQDPQGRVTAYTFDANGNITQTTNPSGSTSTYTNFTTFNHPGKVKDPNGNYAVMKYDARGNLTQEIRLRRSYCQTTNCATLDPASYTPAATDMIAWRVMAFDANGSLSTTKRVRDFAAQVANPTATSNTGPILTISYDTNALFPTSVSRTGRKNAEVSVSTQTATLLYDPLGRIKTGIDGDWHSRQFSYDSLDRVTLATDALGNTRSFQYDINDNPTGQRLDINGRLIDSRSTSFDANDRRTRSVDSGGNVTALHYDPAGNLIQLVTPDNYAYSYEYDPLNRLIRTFDPENNPVSRSLDPQGRPRSITDANGNVTAFDYQGSNTDGRLQSVTDAANRKTSFSYDPNGNATLVSVLGSDGTTSRSTLSVYDELDRATRVVGPQYTDATLGSIRPVTRNTYDSLGHTVEVAAGHTTDLSGNSSALDVLTVQTTSTFDDFSRKTREADGLNRAWVFSHDANNNPATATDPLAQTSTYTWGYGHQLLSVRDQTNATTSYTRNPLGQITRAQSPAVSYDYGYDASQRLSSVRDSRAAKTLTYTYSPGGLLNTMIDADAKRTDHDYDAAGRLAGIWAPNQDYVSLAYDRGGRLTNKWLIGTNGAFVSAESTYNADNTLASLINKAGAAIVSSHSYSYDPLGNRASQAERVGATTTNYAYSYDALNRLTQVNNGNAAQLESYAYDPLGNRTSKQVGSTITAAKYDAANQLTELRSGSLAGALLATLGYDANGNLKTRSDTGLSLSYDALNRMTQATLGAQTSSYVYDDQGRRIQKTAGGTTSNFLYDGPHIVSEYAATWGAPQAQYVQGPTIDNPLIRIGTSTSQYLHQDGINSVVVATSAANTTDASQRFDAWGNKVASTGTLPRFGYTGREPDETGLVFYRARYYDPSIGRFTQRDPIGLNGGMNPYGYAGSSPTNAIDPAGNTPMHVAAGIVGGLGGLLFQAGLDVIRGERSPWQDYVGAAVGGAAGGVAAITCGPACAGAVAGAAGSATTQALNAASGNGSASLREAATSVAVDTALGAVGGKVADVAVPYVFKEYVKDAILKGNIGEGLSWIGLKASGINFETQAKNDVGKSTFDFKIIGDGLRDFVEAKFGTGDLSKAQRLARDLEGTNLDVHRWDYETISGILSSIFGGGASSGSGGYSVGGLPGKSVMPVAPYAGAQGR
jgi:RHS repeat-associated protein